MKVQLPGWNASRFDVKADMSLLQRLTREMEESPKVSHKPATWWMLPGELANGSMDDLMDAWCGRVGQLPLADLKNVVNVSGSPELIPNYEAFLRSIDHWGLLAGVSLQDLAGKHWRVMDLGSLMDLLLLSAFTDFSGIEVIEIGGGYGRLAEFLTLATDARIRYVNVDAVPVSLMYSFLYLKNAFPTKRVRMFTRESNLDEDYDFLILPAWHLDDWADKKFDLAINVESMQEMSQELVDHYLGFFDRVVEDGGLIYLVNAREYKFKGKWNIPDNWQCLLRQRTPRSWTANHPAEIFRRTNESHHAQNILRASFFAHEVKSLAGGRLW